MKTKSGFTLIELLVVIAIVGMMSSIVLASLNTARAKSRDAKRATDLHSMIVAVESYANDNGHYPNTNSQWTSFDSPLYKSYDIVSPDAPDLATALAPYIKPIADPSGATGDAGYLYYSVSGANYCILFWRTPENLFNFGASYRNTLRCTLGIDSNGKCFNAGGQNVTSIFYGTGGNAAGC